MEAHTKYLNNELVQMKVEQDTLRIRLHTQQNVKAGAGTALYDKPYFVMLCLNNIADMETLPVDALNKAVETLKSDIGISLKNKPKSNKHTYYAMYDVVKQKWISPAASNHSRFGKNKYVEPYVQLGMQYLRGAWGPSAGTGLQLIHGYYNADRQIFKLYWEPYFFFSRSAANDLVTQRNDFITFKYNETRRVQFRNIDMNTNFSIAYLVGRRGNFFEPFTFKFAVSGLIFRNLNLEPEFIFNNFFRNFSPSLRLTVEIE